MKIAIAGYGIEGKANFTYWNALDSDVTIVDEREVIDDLPAGIATILGKNAFTNLNGFDLVIRTAGLTPSKIITDGKVWSSTREFFEQCPAPIIGVTGTKGKGTTASLITSILKSAGRTVHLVGNIGVSPLELLAEITSEDIVVFELSSFQLWDLEKSPHTAVVLMIEADHLDVHANFDDYITAKSAITRYQGSVDICLYHPTNELSRQVATSGAGQVYRYAVVNDSQVYEDEEFFMQRSERICPVSSLQLPGAHNRENACAAISVALQYGADKDAIRRGLESFSGLPHRLKLVDTIDTVTFYDDSIATTPGSALAAIQAIDGPKVLILGGYDKGADYTDLIEACKTSNTMVVAIGANRGKIIDLCHTYETTVVEEPGNMNTIVVQSYNLARETHASVILSPAAASFDMFKSYSDRGSQFIEAIAKLHNT